MGNLCEPLCSTRDVNITSCPKRYRPGGKLVAFAEWKNRSVTLKVGRENKASLKLKKKLTFQNFSKRVRARISFLYNATYNGSDVQLLTQLWTGSKQTSDVTTSLLTQHAFMTSLWSLVQQSEFLYSRYFGKHSTRILGTCGYMYAAEFAPRSHLLDVDAAHLFRLKRHLWQDRALLAVKLMDASESSLRDFHEPLYFCDTSRENWVLTRDARLVAIDTDSFLFKSRAESEMASLPCSTHSDCHIAKCQGRCDVTSRRCSRYIATNNLQVQLCDVLCEHLANTF